MVVTTLVRLINIDVVKMWPLQKGAQKGQNGGGEKEG